MLRLIAVLLALGASAPAAQERRGADPGPASVGAVFDSYLDTEPGLFERRLLNLKIPTAGSRVLTLRKAFEKEAPAWIAKAPADRREVRRLAVAAVALIAVNDDGVADFPNGAGLLEWACSLIRTSAQPTSAERTWHWGALALLESASVAGPLQAHVSHALMRFPNEPRFILASGIAAEVRTWPDPRDGRIPRDRDATSVGLTVTRLGTAAGIPDVRAEALTRIAFMALRNGNPAEALPYLRDAEAAHPEPFIAYLIQLFKGRALDRLGRLPDAIAAYRAAVAIIPGQTAQLALAAALARSGDQASARSVAQDAILAAPATKDPWIGYGTADGRFWPEIVTLLRQQVQEVR